MALTQSQIFEGFMQDTWGEDDAELYNEASDARDVAQALGAKPTGDHSKPPSDPWSEWLFPDGSLVWIEDNGHATTNASP